jgi:tetratricopeptide (TPR) repeat protein/CRP-like cAMP-binding protein
LLKRDNLPVCVLQDADLSARNVTHRSPKVFEEIIVKASHILKKKVSAQAGYNSFSGSSSPSPSGSQMQSGGSVSSARHSASTQFSRGYALYRLQQYAQAAEDFLACSRSEPDRAAPALYNRGCALYKLGRHAEAVRDLTKAMKLDTKNSLFIESRARVLKEMGKFEEAIHDYTWLDTLRHHPTALMPSDPSQSLLLEAVCSPAQQPANLSTTSSAASLAYEAQESSAKAWLEQFLRQDPGRPRSSVDVAEAARLARCWSFFRGMRVTMIERCMRSATYYRFDSDQVVVDQGKASAGFHVVLDAMAPLVKTVTFQGSSSRELSTLYQGDTIGLEPSSATNVDGRLVMLRHRAQRQLMLRSRVGSTTSPSHASTRSLGGFQANPFNTVGAAARAAGDTLHPKEVATFSCLGEVNCMLLDMDVYLNILREHEERLLEERLQFLHRCHAFGTCSDEMLAALAAVSGSKLVDPSKDALRAGEVVKQLYVIKKGVCHVLKTITIPHSSHATAHRMSTLASSRLGGSKSEDALTSRSNDGSWVLDNGWMLTNPRLVSNAQALAAARLQHSEEVTVAVLASGQLFGELSVLQPGQHSPVTVRTQTLVELLVFEEEDLSQLRVQYMSGTMNALQESLLFHNPPQQKLAQLRCDLTHWSREKRSVLEELFPPSSPVTKSPAKKKSPRRRQSPKTKTPAKINAASALELPAVTPTPTSAEAVQRPLTSPSSRSSEKKKEPSTPARNTRRSMAY